MTRTLMLSSLFGAVLTLGLGSIKTLEIVTESRCKTFPEQCSDIEVPTKTAKSVPN